MSAGEPDQLLLTHEQMRAKLNVGSATLRRWVAEGLPVVWTGDRRGVGKCLFDPTLAADWLRRRAARQADGGGDPAPPRRARREKGAAKGEYRF